MILLGVGPVLDPIAGSEVTAEDRRWLPSSGHLGGVADLWFVEIVNQQPSSAPVGLFDAETMSSHGRSVTQLRYFINRQELTDPARPGRPLLHLPHGAWDRLRYASLWTPRPGFQWRLEAPATTRFGLTGSRGGATGGGVWLPRDVFDREPARGPTARRAVVDALGVSAAMDLAGERVTGRLFAEHLDHRHRYPLTLIGTEGRRLTDDARRTTALGTARLAPLGVPVTAVVGFQGVARDFEGAQSRLPARLTHSVDAVATTAHVETQASWRGNPVDVWLGVAGRKDEAQPRSGDPWVTDIEDEWMYMARPELAGTLRRLRVDAGASTHLQGILAGALDLELTASQAFIEAMPDIPGNRTALTYLRAPAATSTSVAQTVYDPVQQADEWLRHARLGGEWSGTFPLGTLRVSAALDHAAVGIPKGTRLAFWTPAIGVAARAPLGGAEVFVLARREPQPLTAEVSSFLDPRTPSGNVFAWSDNGDGIPGASETTALLRRTGGLYHNASADLSRPTSNQIAAGVRTPTFGPMYGVLTGVARWLIDGFTVHYDERTAAHFEPVQFRDPGGDGRGETRAPGGGQLLTVYERVPGSEGEETYVLKNRERSDVFLGLEFQFVTEPGRPWFVNLGLAAYLSAGTGPFGSFADRNDPEIIDEVSADPNARVNQRGRLDHDRAFAINLLTGVEPVQDFTLALAVRYRDGQNFTRIAIADLPQGPTPIMAVDRGKPRHTFHWTFDTRVRYAFDLAGASCALSIDGFNILGSGTELLEDPRTGDTFRQPLERVAGRTVFGSLEVAWE